MTRGRERRSQRRVRGVGVWVQGVWGRVGLGEGEGGGKVLGWERVVTIVVFVGGGEGGGSEACGWGCVALLQGVAIGLALTGQCLFFDVKFHH